MAPSSPRVEAQSISWPPPTTHSFDEYSPLLQKTSHHDFADLPSDREPTQAAKDKQLSTSSLLWIMTSVWIGTFLAGLGKNPKTLPLPMKEVLLIFEILRWYGDGDFGSTNRYKF